MKQNEEIYQRVIEQCTNVYNNHGFSGVVNYINQRKIFNDPDYDNVQYEHCKGCESEVPSLSNTCLCCGQSTIPNYFKVIKTGFDKDLQREEIQIHGGENANILLIKTDEGFIVDIYDANGEIVNSMTVWEDDITPFDDDDNG